MRTPALSQIKQGGPVTLTDPDMTRFIMSISEAIRLVVDSAILARGGEVFVTKMPVIRIVDLAKVMIRELAPGYGHNPEDIDLEIIGSKPGEKLYEELMTQEETRRAIELELYYAVKPAFSSLFKDIEYDYPTFVSEEVTKPYNSSNEPILSQKDLRSFLYKNDLLEGGFTEMYQPDRRYWGDEKLSA